MLPSYYKRAVADSSRAREIATEVEEKERQDLGVGLCAAVPSHRLTVRSFSRFGCGGRPAFFAASFRHTFLEADFRQALLGANSRQTFFRGAVDRPSGSFLSWGGWRAIGLLAEFRGGFPVLVGNVSRGLLDQLRFLRIER